MSELLDSTSIIFWGIITFSIVVILHEGGHFAVARFFGVHVHEFMIGLPGPAVRFRSKSGTTFGVTAIPLGGYVRIAGMKRAEEDPLLAAALSNVTANPGITAERLAQILGIDEVRALTLLETLEDWRAIAVTKGGDPVWLSYISAMDGSENKTPEELLAKARSQTYRGLTTGKRIAILSAGVLVNLFAGIALLTFALSTWNDYEHSLTLAEVIPDSAAYEAGLRAGDTITALQGEELSDWEELSSTVGLKTPGDVILVDYLRDGAEGQTEITLASSPEGDYLLGVWFEETPVDVTVIEALTNSIISVGFVFIFGIAGVIFMIFGAFLNPETFAASAEGLSGIVGMSVASEMAAEAGPQTYVMLVAILSLGIGAFNILPIPPLDGGRIVLEIIEKIAGRPLHKSFTMGVSIAGALLLFGLIGYLIYADIMRYFINT